VKKIKNKKISVAMSGGVDSTVAAAILKQEGYDVFGVFMILAQPDLQDQLDRVREVASKLDVPLETVDLSQEFRKEVLGYFCNSYLQGRTPNPCVVCNPAIKCGYFLNAVCPESADKLATGHYARIDSDGQGQYRLLKGRDIGKDQSYFLCGLGQRQLARLVFPLGGLSKDEVYRRAEDLGFSDFHGQESQDVCFLESRSVADFLADQDLSLPGKGEIVDSAGCHLGEHRGIFHYTIGQRRGLGLCDATPWYVIGLDVAKNQVVAGKEKDLWLDRFVVEKMRWTSGSPAELPAFFDVKIRYRHQGARAEVSLRNDGVEVVFAETQRAITPGQFAVFYDGNEVVGCGEIVG
jgi:tRNA-specific 2-thiouridylase